MPVHPGRKVATVTSDDGRADDGLVDEGPIDDGLVRGALVDDGAAVRVAVLGPVRAWRGGIWGVRG